MLTQLSIHERTSFADGHEFPLTGAYEKLVGRFEGEVDPKHRLNRIIVNIDKAPRNRRGRVEYWSDFCILKPADPGRGNGKIFFDAPNRGSKRIISFLNDAPATNNPEKLEHGGNGFLMRQGYTIVWCGWQGDLLPEKNWLVAGVPVATQDGKEIVRLVRTEIVVDEPAIKSQPLSGDDRVKSYEAASVDKSAARLTVREKSYGRRIPVNPTEWEFASCVSNGDGSPRPSTRDLYVRSGFKPGHVYELIYPAKNPLVLGLGFALVRDLVSFLRCETKDSTGQANPLADQSQNDRSTLSLPPNRGEKRKLPTGTGFGRCAYAWGRSQSGRFLRDFVYHGFNEDENGRKVFAAIAPHAAGGGRLFLNYEFARPVTSSQQHTNQLEPELFPHAYTAIRDAQTGRLDAILKKPRTDPLVFHTQTSTEYWQKRGCLAHTDGKGRDIRIPENVRIYVIASAQHNSPFGSEPEKDDTQQPTNPLPAGDILRALMVAMDLWASHGILPPPSQYPTTRDGTLVAPEQRSVGFPKLAGVRFRGLYNRQLFLDYGPNMDRGRIDVHPPRELGKRGYTVLVPKVDHDGNDIAGIRLPAVQVPVATYTGWNLRPAGLAEDELSGLLGSFIPFADTKAERQSAGDPRLSIEERYKGPSDYVRRIARAARALVQARYLLLDDAERIIAEAKAASVVVEEKWGSKRQVRRLISGRKAF